jgi:hypothetical protein
LNPKIPSPQKKEKPIEPKRNSSNKNLQQLLKKELKMYSHKELLYAV